MLKADDQNEYHIFIVSSPEHMYADISDRKIIVLKNVSHDKHVKLCIKSVRLKFKIHINSIKIMSQNFVKEERIYGL